MIDDSGAEREKSMDSRSSSGQHADTVIYEESMYVHM